MFMILSPAKTLDFKSPALARKYTQPAWLHESTPLVERLQKFSPAEIASLMGVSDALAALNVARYAEWSPPFTPENARQAILAFAGDVYEGLDAVRFSEADLDWAQTHLGILSGLYGLLRPLDLIQPYRLEMGIKLNNRQGKDLYAWWGAKLRDAVTAAVAASGSAVLINLASEEYFKAIRAKELSLPVIQPVFEDWKNGQYKIISFYAKRARGLMARYAVENRIDAPEALKDFDCEGYAYVPAASEENTWVFRRRA
jgi:cytoplasmic iron level regulating protein YaaA (DUF328/UPF0246 family)